jgi:hypothetical protein
MSKVFIKRGTRSQLDAAAAAFGLNTGEPYLITDEDRIAVGLSASTYQDYALTSESPSKTFLNNTGSVLEAGSIVYVTGASGQQLTVAKGLANAESTSSKTIGIVYKDVDNGAIGQLVSEGVIKNVNTNGLTEGAALWLSPSVAGGFTTTKPSAPNHAVLVGFVLNASTTAGRIFVKISNGWELEELHNVSISSPTDKQGLFYDQSTGLWKNQAVTKRTITEVSTTTPSINCDLTDIYGLTGQTADISSVTITGTPANGQLLWVYVIGTAARAISWGASFESSTVTLPTTTVGTTRLDVGFIYNSATSKWRCVAVA